MLILPNVSFLHFHGMKVCRTPNVSNDKRDNNNRYLLSVGGWQNTSDRVYKVGKSDPTRRDKICFSIDSRRIAGDKIVGHSVSRYVHSDWCRSNWVGSRHKKTIKFSCVRSLSNRYKSASNERKRTVSMEYCFTEQLLKSIGRDGRSSRKRSHNGSLDCDAT